ncbi:MAG: Gfo/Idh/MocA family oxidoreductase [Methylacidiphilales bacterium]|nr:Gfo/Idh/MocA family oxidoreductase [Candidatus Methylacidiphilales bacterium]
MIRIAIVGTGGMGNSHADIFSKIKGCKIVAGCDINEARVQAFCTKHSIPDFYSDFELMLEKSRIDAVVNVTPDQFHAPLSIRAIQAGKHVLCEKPLALNYAEAMTMVRAAKKKGVINMVNFSYRNAPALHRAHQLVASGRLGDIVHVDASYLQSWLTSKAWGAWRDNPALVWRLSTKHGSMGVLGDVGIHLVDFVTFAVGDMKSVNAQLKTFQGLKGKKHGVYTLDANDTALMQVEFKSGALGMLHTTRWATGHINSIELLVCGTKGALRINLDQGWDRLGLSLGKDIDTGKWVEVSCPPVPRIAERFIKAIRTGVNDQPDFQRGADVQKVLDTCFLSNASGKRTKI